MSGFYTEMPGRRQLPIDWDNERVAFMYYVAMAVANSAGRRVRSVSHRRDVAQPTLVSIREFRLSYWAVNPIYGGMCFD